jgi:hypothetical protein
MKNLMLFVLSRPIFNGLILATLFGTWRFLSGGHNSGNLEECVAFSLAGAIIFSTLVFLFRIEYVTVPGIDETLIKVGPDNKVIDVLDAKRKSFFKKAIWGNEKTEKFYRFDEMFDMDAKVSKDDWDILWPKTRSFTLGRKIAEPQSSLTVSLEIRFNFKFFFKTEDWQAVVDKIIVPAKKFPDKRCDFVRFFTEQLLPIKKDLDVANGEEIKRFRENEISLNALKNNIHNAFNDKLTEHMILPCISGIGVEIGAPTYKR